MLKDLRHAIRVLMHAKGWTVVVVMSLAIGIMVLVSAIAGYIPARRASKVDPMIALHYE